MIKSSNLFHIFLGKWILNIQLSLVPWFLWQALLFFPMSFIWQTASFAKYQVSIEFCNGHVDHHICLLSQQRVTEVKSHSLVKSDFDSIVIGELLQVHLFHGLTPNMMTTRTQLGLECFKLLILKENEVKNWTALVRGMTARLPLPTVKKVQQL